MKNVKDIGVYAKASSVHRCTTDLAVDAGSELRCQACGMVVRSTAEYHPYAACLMFKACGDSDTVRINLSSACADTRRMDKLAACWDSQGKGHRICGRWVPNVTGSFRDAIDALPNNADEPRSP